MRSWANGSGERSDRSDRYAPERYPKWKAKRMWGLFDVGSFFDVLEWELFRWFWNGKGCDVVEDFAQLAGWLVNKLVLAHKCP